MNEELVTIAKCNSLTEAEACRLGLESDGVSVFLTDAEIIRADWLLTNAVGSIKVQVPQSQAERASAILREIRQRNEAQAKETNKDFCLSCGAVMPDECSRCQKCGWSYEDDAETNSNASNAIEDV